MDNPDIPAESLLAVESRNGVTRIGPIDQAGKTALRDKLFTPGELLRMNQFAPDFSDTAPASYDDLMPGI